MTKTKKKIINPPIVPNALNFYLDGSAVTDRVDPNCYGGWGLYITDRNGFDLEYKGSGIYTTVSRMEMTAMKVTLELIVNNYTDEICRVYSDSKMVVDSINKGWLENWYRDNYKGRVNSDIWKPIHARLEELRRLGADFQIIHVKGHQKDIDNPHAFGNAVADKLADYKGFL